MLLTVSQIAEVLCAKLQDRLALMERIRHWTREGLITPAGEKNPGTGRHRRYEKGALAEVAILNALADLGIQIGGMRAALLAAMKSMETWREKLKDQKDSIFLEILNVDGVPMLREHFVQEGQSWWHPEAAEAALVVNITRILRRIESAKFPSSGTAFSDLDRPAIIAAIAKAIDARRIELYLQPVVRYVGQHSKVCYYEALSRLRFDNNELITAADFLPYAEAGSLMLKLDYLSASRCVQLVRRLLVKNPEIGLFCNLSGATLSHPDFPKFLELMEAHRAIAPALYFEFTQSAVRAMGQIEHANLAALAGRGYRFSMDNLTDLQVDARELNERGFRFVKAPATMLLNEIGITSNVHYPAEFDNFLRHCGIHLIAERIDNKKTAVMLEDYNVLGQGLLFSPPRPIREDVMQGITGNLPQDITGDPLQKITGDTLKELVKRTG